MRVPDLSATAGYAASVFNPSNNQRGNHSTNPLLLAPLGSEHNKIGNTPFTGANDYYRGATTATFAGAAAVTVTNYASTADEFVQKALISTPTPEYSPPILNHLNDTSVPHYCCGALPKDNRANPFQDSSYDKDANYTRNTYKSFKEIFNTNKSFYEDCVRDFENINLLRNGVESVNDTDLDPIELINENETQSSNNECVLHSCTNPFDVAFNKYLDANCRNDHTEKLDELTKKSEITQVKSEKVESGFEPDDNDYDDHSMIDLCSDTKSIYDSDEKEDDFLTSASSSSGSLHTPKHSFFPRGIINPNYPGFQHLAHTLSEHFITSSPSDSYESDMSEYEMELSADSFESLNDEKSQINLNNCNNNTPETTMNPKNPFTEQITDNFECIHNDQNDEYCLMDCSKGRRPSVDETNRKNRTNNRAFNITDLQDHLRNTLILLENQQESHENNMHVSITPDILIKNYNLHVQRPHKNENRPDLLRGVSPYLAPEKKCVEQKNGLAKLENQSLNNIPGTRNSEIRDEVSFGLTPVDIIGDFGQEVEREFGLLVSGYRRLVDTQDNMPLPMDEADKISDAALSLAKDEIDTNRYLDAFNKKTHHDLKDKISPELVDDNAVDIRLSLRNSETSHSKSEQSIVSPQPSPKTNTALIPKYQKSSYDDRQLPPIAIEYKRCQQTLRSNKKSKNLNDKTTKVVKNSKPSIASRLLHPKRNSNKSDGSSNRKRDEAELNKYQQLMTDKEQISSNSKYAKLSSWAQYVKNPVNEHSSRRSSDLISPSALELFDAYKIGTEVDLEQFQQHYKMAKEIEKKVRTRFLANFNRKLLPKYRSCAQNDADCVDGMFPRVHSQNKFTTIELTMFANDASFIEPEFLINIVDKFLRVTDPNVEDIKRYSRRSDREEIRRRLAMGGEENCNEQKQSDRSQWKSNTQTRLKNDFSRFTEISSDSDSNSTDSDTCPKLSKSKSQIGLVPSNGGQISAIDNQQQIHPYHGRPLSVSCSVTSINNNNNNTTTINKTGTTITHQQQLEQKITETLSNEDKECDFFTKQAKLQIEARMALSQAKEMAHMQMEIERQNQQISPITAIIRNSLEKVGVQMKADKRRLSRQMLTDMNIAQLQILVNNLHTHIEELNESLVNYLMERDDLHDSQDAMLVDIEELTRYIGAKEHIAQHERISSVNKCSK